MFYLHLTVLNWTHLWCEFFSLDKIGSDTNQLHSHSWGPSAPHLQAATEALDIYGRAQNYFALRQQKVLPILSSRGVEEASQGQQATKILDDVIQTQVALVFPQSHYSTLLEHTWFTEWDDLCC